MAKYIVVAVQGQHKMHIARNAATLDFAKLEVVSAAITLRRSFVTHSPCEGQSL